MTDSTKPESSPPKDPNGETQKPAEVRRPKQISLDMRASEKPSDLKAVPPDDGISK